MKFINKGESFKIRKGSLRKGYYWNTIKKGEVVELPQSRGHELGLFEIKITSGQIGKKKVETKQLEIKKYTSDEKFFKELCSIKGIGKKTAQDIVIWGTKQKLIEQVALKAELPFRDDICLLLRKQFLKIGGYL